MGGSLRRHRKHKPRIIKRQKKKRHVKSNVPPELVVNAAEMKEKLGVEPEWDSDDHVEGNYQRAGLVVDANAGYGRNKRRDVLKDKAEANPEQLDAEVQDDELRAAFAKVRTTGKAAPKRLTSHQRQIVGRLLEAHGDDVAAMQHDRKLNPMQHSQGVLKALIESFRYWKEGSGVDFRVPNKRLW
ncbi:Nucleolar 16 [Chlorella sorokiniana]|uniref:Nucleolar protein 16 n=1 Tax=Chlorella sorokiniana TaxID=3076 RepID=A0A2P6U0U0_CHLSO|nr:Nucleolar 16 [Chlorella sorokiniana]|eukprot:PRW59920.1 Nucleolar 16 [Chlorella sorokiniana]